MPSHLQTRTTRRPRLPLATLATVIVTTLIAGLLAAIVSAPASAAPAGPVHYTVTRAGHEITIAVTDGTIGIAGSELRIRNRAGAKVFAMPLSYRMENEQYPIRARATERSAVLTPVTDARAATPVHESQVAPFRHAAERSQWAEPRTRKERDDQALSRFNEQLSAGMSISSIVGITVGAVVGGTVGCLLGLPFFGIGCVPALLAGASVGSIGGAILGGGGSLVTAGMQYFNTINSPFAPPGKRKPRR